MKKNNFIQTARAKLVKIYKPLEIYLFGSYAWGSPDEDSDLDLLVVVENLSKDRHGHLEDGYRALFNLGMSKDLLIYTKDEFEEKAADKMTLCFKVKHEGRQIYAKA